MGKPQVHRARFISYSCAAVLVVVVVVVWFFILAPSLFLFRFPSVLPSLTARWIPYRFTQVSTILYGTTTAFMQRVLNRKCFVFLDCHVSLFCWCFFVCVCFWQSDCKRRRKCVRISRNLSPPLLSYCCLFQIQKGTVNIRDLEK